MKQELILIGGGGHCKSCIDVIEADGRYTICGILDTAEKIGAAILRYPVIGTDDILDQLIGEHYRFLVTVGQVKSSHPRRKLYRMLTDKNAAMATVISPFAVVSRHAQIGEGSIVMHGAYINADAVIGNNVILNTGSVIEHDVVVGDHVHVSTNAVINGHVKIEDDCFIGSNAVVAQGRHIRTGTVIGAGSVVVKDCESGSTYFGNPAKKIK